MLRGFQPRSSLRAVPVHTTNYSFGPNPSLLPPCDTRHIPAGALVQIIFAIWSALLVDRLHFAFTVTFHYLHPFAVAAALGMILHSAVVQKERLAFAGSTLYLAAMLLGAAFALDPNVLPASTDPAYTLTIYNAAAARYGLTIGITWWLLGMILGLGYFLFVYRMFRGQVKVDAPGEGY